MATPAAQLDQLISTTFEKIKPVLGDQVTRETPLLAFLNAKARVTEDGGTELRRPVLYAFNATTGSYDGYDLINTTPQGGFGYATYSWKQYAGSITIDGKTERINSGAAQVIALMQAKMDQLRASFSEGINVMLWGDGTGNGAKDFLGIKAIVADTGILGGIDPTTETWWKSKVVATSYVLSASGTALAAVKGLNNIYNSLRLVKSVPDLEVTTQFNFESYEAAALPQIRFSDLTLADLGFEAISHKRAEVTFDPNVTTNFWYFLNSEHLEFVQHNAAWMKMLDFVRPVNQDARSALVVSMGNLITDVRRAHGLANNVT